MKIIFQKRFQKQYLKLSQQIKLKVKKRNIVFEKNPSNAILNNHPLHGKYAGYRSINITGDIRVVYRALKKDTFLFTDIGSHSELYS